MKTHAMYQSLPPVYCKHIGDALMETLDLTLITGSAR